MKFKTKILTSLLLTISGTIGSSIIVNANNNQITNICNTKENFSDWSSIFMLAYCWIAKILNIKIKVKCILLLITRHLKQK